ncbi:solute carrier organic anion transporter family member 4C1-like isoform X2 [Dreissena polymorpha]|uniref:solute carrier organic anion transporter family member 4C1-like isoform X2 n=1 Tax=Dreissena polymorpha TaxID=45954 RepID=UPI0022642815|nr:solute carrier organic anion transporter family member 4C1-like isoform X2 [Dreissena polymorpha]
MKTITNIYLLVFLMSMVTFIKEFITGLTSISIPAIERQFTMSSQRTALIPASNEIAATVLVLLVVFIGSHVNRARCLAVGTFIMAIGCVLYIVPHWLDIYTLSDVTVESTSHSLCHSGNATYGGSCGGRENSLILGLFIVAQMVVGVGFIPLLTLGHSYIYDNADPKKTPIFIGIIFAGSNIGQACGFFIAGAITQNVYVDFDRQGDTNNTTGLSSVHWVGAWWLGFVPAALMAVCVAVPLSFYPGQLKGNHEQVEYSTGNNQNASKTRHMCQAVVDFLRTGLKLSKHPVYMFVSLGVCATYMVLFGLIPYIFKYIITIYNVSLVSTGIYLGINILLGAVGVILSGVLIRCLNLEVVGMLRMNAMVATVTAAMGLAFLASCPNVVLAGEDLSGSWKVSQLNTTWPCNRPCHCGTLEFSPVCGADGYVYTSPCVAGCMNINTKDDKNSYGDCSCITALSRNESLHGAMEGFCDSGCQNFWIFAPVLVLMVIVLLMVQTPSTLAILASVEEKSRNLSLGVRKIMIQVLGLIPGPIIMGTIFDSSCRLWNETNCQSSDGECLIYDNRKLSVRVGIYVISFSALSGLLFLIGSLFASRSNRPIDSVPNIERK